MKEQLTEFPLSMAEVLSSLSYALDLTSGQSAGHAQRSCLIAMRIAREIGLPQCQQTSLYQAMLIKDAGCSSNAARMFEIFGSDDIDAKRAIRIIDWSNVTEALKFAETYTLAEGGLLARARRIQTVSQNLGTHTKDLFEARCSRGAQIARSLGLGEDAALTILYLDEHWNGGGMPYGLRGDKIPLLARIASIAQTLDVFSTTFGLGMAYEVLRERQTKWFDPALVAVAHSFRQDDVFWHAVKDNTRPSLLRMNNQAAAETISPGEIDNVCDAFAQIIDAKSRFTGEHSSRVRDCAVQIARAQGLDEDRVTLIRRAALLHDIGKLAVPNTVLDKPGPLGPEEWKVVHRHPIHTHKILGQITGFGRLADVASAHHERLDGSGYCNGLRASEIDQDMRIIAVADVWDALSSQRPYRPAMSIDHVFSILDTHASVSLDADCIAILKEVVSSGELQTPVPLAAAAEEDDLLQPLPMAA